jgi:hypothetical protein
VTRAGVTLTALLACACTPTVHHLEPYSSDPAAAEALERRAQAVCSQTRGVTPPHLFTTDGCSMWPDDGWVQCCVEHDIAYWCGGTNADREHADVVFRDCVSAAHDATMAWIMYWAVRVGGGPSQPFPWRWAYGWDYYRGYDAPTTAAP